MIKDVTVGIRNVLINILSFDDNIMYEFCIRECGTLILYVFHFRKSIKSMHKSAFRSTDPEVLDGFIRTWSGKTSEDGPVESEHELESIKRWKSKVKALKL